MSDVERIRDAVYRTIGAINDFLPAAQALEASDDLALLGEHGSLDSMGYVNFLVALEEELERELGRDLNIANLLNMEDKDGAPVCIVADLIKTLSEHLG